MKSKYWIILGAILLLALSLRIYGLGTRDLWYDEAFSFFLAKQPPAEIVSGTAADTEPPLYYFLLHLWLNLGESPLTLRLLSVLISMGIVGVVFDLTRRLAGFEAGLWAALLTAIAPFQIYHAQELRMYGLVALAQLTYFWFFIRLQQLEQGKRSIGLWVGLALSGAAAMYSQSLAIFGLVLPDLYLLLKRSWRGLRQLMLAQGVMILLALPWLMLVPGQIDKIQTAFYTPRPGLAEILQAVLQAHAFMPLEGIWLTIAAVLSLQCVVMVGIEAWKARKVEGVSFVALVAAGLPALLFVVSYFMRPIFVPRGFIGAMVMYLVLAGWMISLRRKNGVGLVIAGAFIAAAAISLPSYYTFSEFPRSPFLETAQYLRENAPNELILNDNKLSYFSIHYYDPGLNQVFLPDEPGSHNDTYALASQQAIKLYPVENLQTAIAGQDRVVFVVFTRAIEEYREMGYADHPVLAGLKQLYRLEAHTQFEDLEIYTFSR